MIKYFITLRHYYKNCGIIFTNNPECISKYLFNCAQLSFKVIDICYQCQHFDKYGARRMTEEDRAKLETEDACVNVDRFVVRVGESYRGTYICSCQTHISANIFPVRCVGYTVVAGFVYVWQFPLCFHASCTSHTGRQFRVQVMCCITKRMRYMSISAAMIVKEH